MLNLLLALLIIGSPLMPRKPVTLDERLGVIERTHREAMLAIGAEFGRLGDAIRSHDVARGVVDRSLAESRLDPGRLDALSGPWRGGSFGRPPDLGQPLLSRLRDDNLTQTPQQSTDVSTSGGNVLADPLFEAVVLGTAVTPGTVDTALGPYWYTKYVHNSGTNPSLRNLAKAWARNDQVGRSNGGSAIAFTVAWAAGGADGDETYYLYPPSPGISDIFYNANATASLPFVVASAMVIPASFDADLSSVAAYIEIIDAVTFAVIATSEAVELIDLVPGQRVPMSVATDAFTSPGGGSGWTWRFRLGVVRSGAGAVSAMDVRVEDPSFVRSYTETAPPSEPRVGHWYPPQLVLKTFVFANLPANATTDLYMSDAAMSVGRIIVPAYFAIAGVQARLSANKTAGTLTVRGIVNGTYQTGDPSVTVGNGTQDSTPVALLLADQANFISADISSTVGVEAIASVGFLPDATAEIIVDLYLWIYQA